MDARANYFESLEAQAVDTIAEAKRAADSTDTGIWELPSGKYIAMPRGPVVPDGAIRVATRPFAGAKWRLVSDEEYQQIANQEYSR